MRKLKKCSRTTGAAKKPGKKKGSKPVEAERLSEAEAPQEMPQEVVASELQVVEVKGKRSRKPKVAKERAP